MQSALFPIIPLEEYSSVSWDSITQLISSICISPKKNICQQSGILSRVFRQVLLLFQNCLETIIFKKKKKKRQTWADFCIIIKKMTLDLTLEDFFAAQALEQIRKPLYCYLLHSYPFFPPLWHFDIGTEQQYA